MRSSTCRLLLAVLATVTVAAPLSAATVVGTLGFDPDQLAGTDEAGRVLLFAPNPLQVGSSVSHFDNTAFPNLLMEPSVLTGFPIGQTDVTPAVMRDLGWPEGQATINLNIIDPPDQGFNDPELGEARRSAMRYAADRWQELLASSVVIDIDVQFDTLPCSTTGIVLAQAGPQFAFENFANAPIANTWYPSALAESLAEQDLSAQDPDNPGDAGDLIVIFNDRVDEGCIIEDSSFFYGTEDPPNNTLSFVTTAMHEIAHGLGFTNFVDERTGRLLLGGPDIYTRLTFDNTQGAHWHEMTDSERRVSALNTGELVWDGSQTTAAAADFLQPGPALLIASPPSIAGSYRVTAAVFGPPLADPGITGDLVLAVDGSGANTICEPVANIAEVSGNIALVDRGGCPFTDKTRNAQDAGAVGLVIVNNQSGPPPTLGGNLDNTLLIPTVGIAREDGDRIKEALADTSTPCIDDATHLCLSDERFLVEVSWGDFDGNRGSGQVVGFSSDDSGLFWFFSPDNWEMLVKVIDACSFNDRFWVFSAATTNVEYTLQVTDTETGRTKEYRNPLGNSAAAITDTDAFATCP